MLNSEEIAAVLVANGFKLQSDPQRTKARAYKHPGMAHPVYVKVNGKVGALEPSTSSPLVVHHDDAKHLTARGVPSGVVLNDEPYKSTGLTAYRRSGHGDTSSGRDLSLAHEAAVRAVIALLLDTADAGTRAQPEQAEAPEAPAGDPHAQMDGLTTADFANALQAQAEHITAAQRAMLIGHALAPGHALSMEAIALHGGYDSYTAANSQYGRLGRTLANHFGITGLANQVQALALEHGDRDALGHFVWEMRSNLLAALQRLGWVSQEAQAAITAESAEQEVDNEGRERSPTTRQALVSARIGQGLYREQMLDIWHQRCAVTGCTLRSVLIASHARAWKESSDAERLDPYNGLPLTASIDKLFDQGLISFADDGSLLRDPALSDTDLAHLGMRLDARLRSECLHPRHLPYLAAHRAAHGF